jgi:hypothetical protein
MVLLAAWSIGAASAWTAAAARMSVTFVTVVLLAHTLGAAYVFADVARDLDTGGLSDSWEKTTRRFRVVREELRHLPPVVWSDDDAAGVMSAARYIAECTNPDDRMLAVSPIHEILVLARRRLAAGQGMFNWSMYTSERDQQRALERLTSQSVPIVLVDRRDFEDGLVLDYPAVSTYLAGAYRKAGTIAVDGEARFLVFVETHRHPSGTDPRLGLPCFR